MCIGLLPPPDLIFSVHDLVIVSDIRSFPASEDKGSAVLVPGIQGNKFSRTVFELLGKDIDIFFFLSDDRGASKGIQVMILCKQPFPDQNVSRVIYGR